MNTLRRAFRWTTDHLFHNYIRRGVGATRLEFLMSVLCLPAGAFLFYLATEPNSKSVPWSITTPIFQIAVVAIPWLGGLLVFGYLFGRRFGYEPLRDVDMMAAGRSGGYAAAAAAGLVALSKLVDQFWGG